MHPPFAITRRRALRSFGAMAGLAAWVTRPTQLSAAQQPMPVPTTLADAVSLEDFVPLARKNITPQAFAYIHGGAADELTVRWNREALNRIRLRSRVLVDVSQVDTRVTLFGQALSLPVLLAPTAFHGLVHPKGEVETARGAAKAKATMVISTFASARLEDIVQAANPPPWFQLYVQTDRGFSRELIQRAEQAGCPVLCVTVDTPVSGARNRQARAKIQFPWDTPNFIGGRVDKRLTWQDLDWLRASTRLPMILKGVLDPEDADRAVKAGVDGLIVSNHGGRNLDTVPASIEALPVVAEKVTGRVPLLMDGGVRRGTDVVKALALGASAVLIGRPTLYGLGAGAADGVQCVVSILRTELEMAMALTGRTSISAIDRSVLW